MRLNKFLANCGVASRRKCDELIFNGKVKVNGEVVTHPGFNVDPENDKVEVEGEVVKLPEKIYIALNKPKGVLCSLKDDFGRTLITELIDGIEQRIYPVGRLDYNSEGLIILTNDGELANRLIHPRYKVSKKYHVLIKGKISQEELKKIEEGIELDGKKTLPAQCKILSQSEKTTLIEITIKEGRKRQIRRMFQALGYEVKRLRRVQFGPIKLGMLKPGEWRYLNENEIKRLKKLTGLEE